ncbi:hypothetical protein D3C73_1325330 [compost metagenome]
MKKAMMSTGMLMSRLAPKPYTPITVSSTICTKLRTKRTSMPPIPYSPIRRGVMRRRFSKPDLRISTMSTMPNKPAWATERAIIPVSRKSALPSSRSALVTEEVCR